MVGVLYSINRPHTDNIKSGLKLWEIRKTKPNIPVPFPAFIYETKRNGGCGKVIGEFICDNIIDFWYDKGFYLPTGKLKTDTCLTNTEFYDYGKGKPLYGLHISNLKIYDKPKELSEFKGRKLVWRGMNHIRVFEEMEKPPQSMCYVEI